MKLALENEKDHHYWSKRLKRFKYMCLFDYAFGMTGFVYRNFWLTANGISLEQVFILNIFGLVFSGIFQNYTSRLSDKLGRRLPFIIGAIIGHAIGLFTATWSPYFISFIIYIFLWNCISGENARVVMAYDMIDRSKDPNMNEEENRNFNRSKEFAKFRIFGSIGFAVMAPIVGYSIHYINIANGLDPVEGKLGFIILFNLSAIFYLIYAAVLYYTFRDYNQVEKESKKKEESELIYQDEGSEKVSYKFLFTNVIFVSILLIQVLLNLARSIGMGAIDLYFKSLGANLIFIGWRPFIWAMVEIPLFFLSARLAKKKGYLFVMALAIIVFTIRLSIYFFLMDASLLWLELFLSTLNTFGITWPAITSAFNENIDKKYHSSSLTVFQTSQQVFGFFGGLVAIYITKHASSNIRAFNTMFLVALIIILVDLSLIAYFSINKRKKSIHS